MDGSDRVTTEEAACCRLEDRALIAVGGADSDDFLQGLVSNDVRRASATQALWAAFLTPQGKYLHDFFLVRHEGRLLLETEAARLPDLLRRLKLYKLRSKVELADLTGAWRVAAVWGPGATARFGLAEAPGSAAAAGAGVAFVDPRHAGLGLRLLLPEGEAPQGLTAGARSDWERLRIGLGLPDGSRDLEVEKATLLENGFDELQGVDWRKGCYMGQELTARMKYRGLVKKRLVPVEMDGVFPDDAEAVEQAGKQVGSLRSRAGGKALALIRLEALASGEPLTAAGRPLRVALPGWMVLPQPKAAAS